VQEKEFLIHSFLNSLSSDIAKNLFQENSYFASSNELQENLIISKEVYQFTKEFHSLYFLELVDIRNNLSLTQKDYVLDTNDIYNTYQYLWQWHQITEIIIDPQLFPNLYQLVHQNKFPKHLLSSWQSIFSDTGDILDSASSELKRIRSLKKQLRSKIEKQLNNQLNNNEDLAEKRFAFREDRYVLPIKSIAKNRTNGIIHGHSKTGSVTYIEPIEIIQLNNELLSVDDLEFQEINRLLRSWSKIIKNNYNDILLFIIQSTKLEILFTKANFAHKYNFIFVTLSPHNHIFLYKVYNPFLLLKKGLSKTTPISLELGNNENGIIISGPNAGGKSAALKTLALCVDMFLLGLPIPAEEAEIPFFTDILFEFGDSQSLDNELSTFSAHLLNINSILQKSSPSTLVLIDEIAHATDPIEGEALGCAIIDALIQTKTVFAITTHYRKVKIKAFEHKNITIYSTGYDLKTLQAQYHLHPNTIGESYALQIASKVGLPQNIINQASQLLKDNSNKTEEILANLEEYERKLREKELELLQNEQKQIQLLEELQKKQESLQVEKNILQSQGLERADKELNICLKELSMIQKDLTKNPKQASQKLKQITNQLNQKKIEITKLSHTHKTYINKGDSVYISSLNKNGIIEEISNKNIFVRVGILKISVKKSDIFEIKNNKQQKFKPITKNTLAPPKTYVDVHGLTGDEAINILEKHLYPAFVYGLHEFAIIHGKGTGILQKRIHQYLKTVPEVKKFAFATPNNGGSGKTIINFIL